MHITTTGIFVIFLLVMSAWFGFLETPRTFLYALKSVFAFIAGCGIIYLEQFVPDMMSIPLAILGVIVTITISVVQVIYEPSTFDFLPDGEKCEANSSPEQGEVFFLIFREKYVILESIYF